MHQFLPAQCFVAKATYSLFNVDNVRKCCAVRKPDNRLAYLHLIKYFDDTANIKILGASLTRSKLNISNFTAADSILRVTVAQKFVM
jgi:hypothetical protein